MKSTAPVTALQKKVTVSVVGTTQFLDIACSDKTKLGAQTCSQAFADAYLQFKTTDATKNRDARIANANAALNPINAQIVEATKRLAAAPVGSPAQAEAQSTLRSLQDQGAPYRQVLADMAKLNVNDAGRRAQRRQPSRHAGQPQAQDQRRPRLVLRPLPRAAGGLRPGPGRQPAPGSGRPRGVPAGPGARHGAPHPAQRPHRPDAGHHAAPEQPRLRGLPGSADPGAGHGRAPGPEDDHGRLPHRRGRQVRHRRQPGRLPGPGRQAGRAPLGRPAGLQGPPVLRARQRAWSLQRPRRRDAAVGGRAGAGRSRAPLGVRFGPGAGPARPSCSSPT